MEQFNKLSFSIRQWPGSMAENITVDFDKESIEVSSAGNTLALSCNNGVFSNFARAIRKCHVEKWSSMDAPVLEGTVWSLELYSNGRQINSCQGIDRFPPRWTEFMKIVTPALRKLNAF